jgi:hypothetical protein
MESLMKISTIFDETGFAMGVIATANVVTMSQKVWDDRSLEPYEEGTRSVGQGAGANWRCMRGLYWRKKIIDTGQPMRSCKKRNKDPKIS